MAFTYSIGTDAGKVRLRIGDTREQTYSLSDDEITAALAVQTDLDAAAVVAHEWFLAKLADYITTSAGGQNHQLQQKFDQHLRLHKEILVPRASKSRGMTCYAGGLSKTRLDAAKQDTDFPQPFGEIGRDDIDVNADDDVKDD